METSEISIHALKISEALRTSGRWMTSKEVSEASGIAYRTARHHCSRMVDLGVLDMAEVFPGHRYRWSEMAIKRNAAYVKRLDSAKEIFGLAA